MKRATKLDASELSNEDLDYFMELGGDPSNIGDLYQHTPNIDSVAKGALRFQNLDNSRKRRRTSNRERNSNNFVAASGVIESVEVTTEDTDLMRLMSADSMIELPPPLEAPSASSQKQESEHEAIQDPSTYLASLKALKANMDVHEREQLQKRLVEIDRVTRQKVLSMTDSIKQLFLAHPGMIGSVSGVEDQVTLAFNIWLAHFRPAILAEPAIHADQAEFARRLLVVKSNEPGWRALVERWRMTRILSDDDFGAIIAVLKEALQIAPVPENVVAASPPETEQQREEKNVEEQ